MLQTVSCETIYLFGSYAYGIPNEDSDYDFFIILPDNGIRPLDAIQNISLALIGKTNKKPVDVLAKRHSEFDHRKDLITLEKEVFEKGIIIYEQ